VLNAAHEVALDGFIAGQIGFLDMAGLVEDTLSRVSSGNGAACLDDVFDADARARQRARALIEQRRR
jgi:1-deoxy-D-xylulose-5-phosphate reductoisomerase